MLQFLSSDYVGFIKKCMKQMQGPRYSLAKKIDLEIQHLEQGEAPTSPGNSPVTHSYFPFFNLDQY